MSVVDKLTALADGFRKQYLVSSKLSIDNMINLFNPNPNLYEGTKDFSGNWGYNFGTSKDKPGSMGWYKDRRVNGFQVVSQINRTFGGLYRYYPAKPGEHYTFSFFAKYSRDSDNFLFFSDDVGKSKTPLHLTTEWQRYSLSFVVDDGVTKIDPRINSTDGNGVLSLYGIKLEKGDLATPWVSAASEKVGGVAKALLCALLPVRGCAA